MTRAGKHHPLVYFFQKTYSFIDKLLVSSTRVRVVL